MDTTKTEAQRTLDLDLDLEKLGQDARVIEQAIRERKACKRESRQPRWTFKLERELADLQVKASICYTVRALWRGRHHFTQTKYPYAGYESRERFEAYAVKVAHENWGQELLQATG